MIMRANGEAGVSEIEVIVGGVLDCFALRFAPGSQ
jgi:hypothetical protein